MKLFLENGTIENFKYCDHKRAKNWVAIVSKDQSQPGGLSRVFLDRGNKGRVRLSPGVIIGSWLEFAGDYYTASGKKNPDRVYCRVEAVTPTEIDLLECTKGKVEPSTSTPAPAPAPARDVMLKHCSDEELINECKRRGLAVITPPIYVTGSVTEVPEPTIVESPKQPRRKTAWAGLVYGPGHKE